MGMNYYHRSKPCVCCGAVKVEKHIGKSSHGWQFHFRGYRDEGIISFNDWVDEFSSDREIVNENGEIIPTREFMERVVAKRSEKLNHYNIVCNLPMNEDERKYLGERPHLYPSEGIEKRTWKDDEGYCFTDWEFC